MGDPIVFTRVPAWMESVASWFDDQESGDIEVRLKDNQVLSCHRIVLRSCSTVWAAALQDKKESILELVSHEASIVTMCLKYCYTANIELTSASLPQVHLFAYQYNIKELKSACEKVMTEGVSIANAVTLYEYFGKHDFPSMPRARDAVKAFVCSEFVAVAESAEFLRLPEDIFCQILENWPIVANEDNILDACCRWLGDSPDPHTRERVLKCVRFPMLSAQKLIEFKFHRLFQPDLEARHYFSPYSRRVIICIIKSGTGHVFGA